jgi:hypothetical protein
VTGPSPLRETSAMPTDQHGHDDHLIGIREIRALFGLGRTAAYELVRHPGFPAVAPVSSGPDNNLASARLIIEMDSRSSPVTRGPFGERPVFPGLAGGLDARPDTRCVSSVLEADPATAACNMRSPSLPVFAQVRRADASSLDQWAQ